MTSPSPASSDAARVRRGILWMLVTTIFFISLDTTAKYLSRTYPIAEIAWARFFFAAVFAGLWAGRDLRQVLRSERLFVQGLRGLFLAATTGIYFLGVRTVPIADATAISFMVPILVTALSVPLLGEPVGIRRWTGVAIGFIGALIIVRPGQGVMQPAALIVLGSAGVNAFYQIATRVLALSDAPSTTNLYSAIVGTLLCVPFLPFEWRSPDLAGWLLFVLAGWFGAVGHYCMIRAMALAPAAAVVPFNYVGLLWATIYGYLLFGDLPDRWTLLGALLIAGSGLYIFYRGEAKKQPTVTVFEDLGPQ